MSRTAYLPEENLFGITTVVTEQSKDGLPNGTSREPETNLPPGAATPMSVRKEDTADGNGRVLSSDSPSYNGPGTGEPGPFEHPRTTGVPGEQEGSPTKYDYNMLTRRTMTATEKEAYKPRMPWRRQRRQRVWDKIKSKRDYRENKSRIKHRAKLWYKRVHKNRQFTTRKEKRRDKPLKYKRRRQGEMAERVASRHLEALGEIILRDQRSPEEGRWEKPDSDPAGSPVGPGQWTKSDPTSHAPSSGGMPEVNIPDSGGSGKVIPDSMKTAATIADIEKHVAADVAKRARAVKVSLSRADTKNGIWTFRAMGSEGKSYLIRVKAEREGNTKEVGKLQVKLSCSCDFFKFQGPEHWAKTNGYLYGKPRGTAAAPTEKDASGRHWACKHALAALALARKYRVASEGVWWPAGAEVIPDFESGPSAARVAARYGGA